MTMILLNIKEAVSNSAVLNVCKNITYWFWAISDHVYLWCFLLITLCICINYSNTLIYKVLNLAMLSVFTVGLWSYSTDLTFIYIVYILTFVSAVVMLFLSVVLMLPSSVMSVRSKSYNSAMILVISADWSHTLAVPKYVVIIAILISTYLIHAAYLARGINPDPKRAKYPVKLQFKKTIIEKQTRLSGQILSLHENYKIEIYPSFQDNDKAVKNCLDYEFCSGAIDKKKTGDSLLLVYRDFEITKYIAKVDVINYPVYPNQVYVKLTPKYYNGNLQVLRRSRAVNFILLVLHEFLDFYFRMLEPTLFLEYKVYRYIVAPLKKFVGLSPAGRPTRLAANWYDEDGWRAQCRAHLPRNEDEFFAIFVLYTPWWSPFRVFRKYNLIFPKLQNFFKSVLQTYTETRANLRLPNRKHYTNLIFVTFVFIGSIFKNILSIVNFKINKTNSESAVQLVYASSVFLSATPLECIKIAPSTYSLYALSTYFPSTLENLAAIQNILYLSMPVLMLVCVTTLLVALIGASVFTASRVVRA